MQKILSLIEENEKIYADQLERIKNFYTEGREFLLEPDTTLKVLRCLDQQKVMTFLINFCKAAPLFADKPVIKKLRSIGITTKVLRWFVSIDKLEKRFTLIEKKQILVLRNFALMNIHLFLDSKIRVALQDDIKLMLKLPDESDVNLKKETVKLYRRREYANGNIRGELKPLQQIINDTAQDIEKQFSDRKKAKLFHNKIVGGKTEDIFLKELLKTFIPKKEFEQTQFLSTISYVFKLICKDKKIMSNAEYEAQESSYENNYKRYLAFRVKKITGFKPAKDDLRNIWVH